MSFSDSDLDLFDRYFAGTCTPFEAAELDRRLMADPELRASAEALRASLRSHPEAVWDTEGAVQRLTRELQEMPPIALVRATGRVIPAVSPNAGVRSWMRPAIPPVRQGSPWRVRLSQRIGAQAMLVGAVVMMIVSGTVWYQAKRTHAESMPSGELREYKTDRGERATIQLSDGTRVTLGVASRIQYSAQFGASDAQTQAQIRAPRTVTVTGEAYFDVAHDPTHPFTVLAGNAATEVLGTAFAVRAYPDDPNVSVTVSDGKVALRPVTAAAGSGITLTRGDVGRLDAVGLATLTRGVNVQRQLAWTRGELAFELTPLHDAVRELERWYDVDITLASPTLANKVLTLTFTNESRDAAIAKLAMVLGVRVTRQGRVITITDSPV